jgi:hypothetical protein
MVKKPFEFNFDILLLFQKQIPFENRSPLTVVKTPKKPQRAR